jgi:hypothetical protein
MGAARTANRASRSEIIPGSKQEWLGFYGLQFIEATGYNGTNTYGGAVWRDGGNTVYPGA